MNPSVQKTTIRSRRGSAGASSAARIPWSISVPPPPESWPSQRLARETLSGVAGTGAGVIACAAPSNAMIWKVSSGPIAPRARSTSAFARSMGCPIIEPDLSRRNTSSFGRTSAGATSAGGCTKRSSQSSPFSRCTIACAPGADPAGRQDSTKSLSGTRSPSSRATSRAPSPTPVTTRWLLAATSSNASAGTSRTRRSTSCAARLPGGSTGGVTRDASGTRSVSADQPGPECGESATGEPGT